MVIRHATLVSVTTHELLDDTDIAIAEGRVAYLGIGEHTAEHCIGPKDQGHRCRPAPTSPPPSWTATSMLESAMIGPSEYARAVVPHGTSGIYWDPHEAMNVAGLDALRELQKDSERVPLKLHDYPWLLRASGARL